MEDANTPFPNIGLLHSSSLNTVSHKALERRSIFVCPAPSSVLTADEISAVELH